MALSQQLYGPPSAMLYRDPISICCRAILISYRNCRPIQMNYFEEGEKLKATFDSLIKQHKKTKKKVLENNNMDKEVLSRHEEARIGIMRFFEENHNFIRPRKNSFGVFSVEDFVKFKTRESASFSMSTGGRSFPENMPISGFGKTTYSDPYGNRNEMMYRRNTVSGVFPFYGASAAPSTSAWNNAGHHERFKMMEDHLNKYPRGRAEGMDLDERYGSRAEGLDLQSSMFGQGLFESNGKQEKVFEMGNKFNNDTSESNQQLHTETQYEAWDEPRDERQSFMHKDETLEFFNPRVNDLNQFLNGGFDYSKIEPDVEMSAREESISGRAYEMPKKASASSDDMAERTRRQSFVGFKAPSNGYVRDRPYNTGFLGGKVNSPYAHSMQGKMPFDGMRAAYSPPIARQDFFSPNFQFISNMGMNPRVDPGEDSGGRNARFSLFCNRVPDMYYRNNYNSEVRSSLYHQPYAPSRDDQNPNAQFFPSFGMNPNDFAQNISPHSLSRNIPPASTFVQTPSGPIPQSYSSQGGSQFFNVVNGKHPSKSCLYGTLQPRVAPDSKPKGKRGRKPKSQRLSDPHQESSTVSAAGILNDGFKQDILGSPGMTSKASEFSKETIGNIDEKWSEILQQNQGIGGIGSGIMIGSGADEHKNIQKALYRGQEVINLDTFENNLAKYEEGFPVDKAADRDTAVVDQLQKSKTIEDVIEITGPYEPIDVETRKFIYELCDSFIEHMMHMSCALAYHRNKNTVEICDVKLTLKTEINLEFPEDSFHISVRNESEEHVKKLKMIKKDINK